MSKCCMHYLFEQLTGDTFQQLCQALLAKTFPGVHCYPVNQKDGGRDAARGDILFQCKWTGSPNPDKDPVPGLATQIRGELPKVARLYERGARRYIFLTNMRGSAAYESGMMDRLDNEITKIFAELPELQAECWWADTLDRHVDGQYAIQWNYPHILSGPAVANLLLSTMDGPQKEARDYAMRSYLRARYNKEGSLRFKQIGLESNLTDLFIETSASATYTRYLESSEPWQRMTSSLQLKHNPAASLGGTSVESFPVLRLLTSPDTVNRILISGGPGQGKSTLVQYIAQYYRAVLLSEATQPYEEMPANAAARLPFKVDLRDYAQFRERQRRGGSTRSLEGFIAMQVADDAGGVQFTPEDLRKVLAEVPSFIALDGLDEIAALKEQNAVVEEIEAFGHRLSDARANAVLVVTSRPAIDARLNRPRPDVYMHLDLNPLSRSECDAYVDRWLGWRNLSSSDTESIREVWSDRRGDPHIQDICRNAMQLSILLDLIHSRGRSLPDRRTLVYDEYVRVLFDREGTKAQKVAEYRDLLIGLHKFLAYRMHGDAEESNGSGRVTNEELRSLVEEFLTYRKVKAPIADLFIGVQRVVALVSRVDGTFEFEVQPLREYFAGRFLYDSAPSSWEKDVPPGQRHHRLFALIPRPYWRNVLRFFAGCYNYGEIDSLARLIIDASKHTGEQCLVPAREVMVDLIGDGVFLDRKDAQAEAIRFAFDEIGLAWTGASVEDRERRVVTGEGGISLTQWLLTAVSGNDPWLQERAAIALHRFVPPRRAADEWTQRLDLSGDPAEIARWLNITAKHGLYCEPGASAMSDLKGLAESNGQLREDLSRSLLKFELSDAEFPVYLQSLLGRGHIPSMLNIDPDNPMAFIGSLITETRFSQATLMPRAAEASFPPAIKSIWVPLQQSDAPHLYLADWLFEVCGGTPAAQHLALSRGLANVSPASGDDAAFSPRVAPSRMLGLIKRNANSSRWWKEQVGALSDDPVSQGMALGAMVICAGTSAQIDCIGALEDIASALPADCIDLVFNVTFRRIQSGHQIDWSDTNVAIPESIVLLSAAARRMASASQFKTERALVTGMLESGGRAPQSDLLRAYLASTVWRRCVMSGFGDRALWEAALIALRALATSRLVGTGGFLNITGEELDREQALTVLADPRVWPTAALQAAQAALARSYDVPLLTEQANAKWELIV